MNEFQVTGVADIFQKLFENSLRKIFSTSLKPFLPTIHGCDHSVTWRHSVTCDIVTSHCDVTFYCEWSHRFSISRKSWKKCDHKKSWLSQCDVTFSKNCNCDVTFYCEWSQCDMIFHDRDHTSHITEICDVTNANLWSQCDIVFSENQRGKIINSITHPMYNLQFHHLNWIEVFLFEMNIVILFLMKLIK